MTSIESYFLAHTIQRLFPLAKFEKAGKLGDLSYADFLLPFEINLDLVSQIQENLKALVKSPIEHHVYHMVPKVAKEFLNHHHQKPLAQLIDDEEPFVNIVQLEKVFYLSDEEVSLANPGNQIKVLDSKKYTTFDGASITRIYCIFENDSKELKQKVKIAQSYLKRDLFSKLSDEKIIGERKGEYFLREKGLFFEFDLIKKFSEVIKCLGLEIVDLKEDYEDRAYVRVNRDFDMSLFRGPYFDVSHLLASEPLFKSNSFVKKEHLQEGLKKILGYLTSWLKEHKINYEVQLSSGDVFLKEFTNLSESLSAKLGSTRSQKKGNIKIFLQHPLNFNSPFFTLQLEQKQQGIFLKFDAFQQIVGIYSWIEDASL